MTVCSDVSSPHNNGLGSLFQERPLPPLTGSKGTFMILHTISIKNCIYYTSPMPAGSSALYA